jgi:hypothetical protein
MTMSKAAATKSVPGPSIRRLGSGGNARTSPVLSKIDPPVLDNGKGDRERPARRNNDVTAREIALVVEQISEPTPQAGGLDPITATQLSPQIQ